MKQNPGKISRSERLVWLLVSLTGFIGACGKEAPVEQAEIHALLLRESGRLVEQWTSEQSISSQRGLYRLRIAVVLCSHRQSPFSALSP